MKFERKKAVVFALLAATLYAISSPVSKILLKEIPPILMAALLYLGAGMGMLVIGLLRKQKTNVKLEAKLSKNDLPFIAGMIILDIAAPIFLMIGLTMTTAENASLLNNFEIVSTSLIAMIIFKEHISNKLWLAISMISFSSIILSVKDMGSFSFSLGSFFVLIACTCWGFENNCTRMLSIKDPLQIVVIKGFGAGLGSLFIAFVLGKQATNYFYIAMAILLGFFAYGLSIYFYVYAQRELGAAKTSAYYAISPFIGVTLSILIFREKPGIFFLIALFIMIISTCLVIIDKHSHSHAHSVITHDHLHSHDDVHHDHSHLKEIINEYSHNHHHEEINHVHEHDEDVHHIHVHKNL